MKILVLNCGSSSLKYQLIDMDNEAVLAKGLVERIGIEGSVIKHTKTGMDAVKREVPFANHTEAIKYVLSMLTDVRYGVLKSLKELSAVGHRTVHGGEEIAESVIITDEVIDIMKKYTPLAPLHNPANLQGIEAVREVLPEITNVGVFDTAFHQTMPPKAYIYAIPYNYYTEDHVRRYGFHGTSHLYVSRRAAEILGKPVEELKIITCHLGNGSSITAVENGKSIDTTMGFSPTAGLIMGTRSGDIDPTVLTYLMEAKGIDDKGIVKIINKDGGLLGVSGVSSDLRDVEEAAAKGNMRAQLAIDILYYEAQKSIGAYAAAMNGVDAIVFTAGIGENSSTFREKVCEKLTYLGVSFDKEANNVRGEERIISKPDSKVKVLIVPTNEELMIARETKRLVEAK